MTSRNPALSDQIFEREIQASRQGSFTPNWGSPADELPPGMFGGQQQAPGQAPGQLPPPYQPGQQPPQGPVDAGPVVGDVPRMRVGGVTSATAILLAIVAVTGWFGWQSVELGPEVLQADGTVTRDFSFPAWLWVSWIAGFGIAILTIFKPKLARITAPLYAAAQGLLVGALSAAFEAQFTGIVLQAVMLTMAVFAIMLVLFASGAIKVTNKLRIGIIVATAAVAVVYLVSILIGVFGGSVPMIHDAGPIGIGFSLLVVGIAAFNLLLDFDFVQRGVAAGAPRYLEWFAAFGLILTLIWLYLELLRLLAKLRQN